MTRLLSLLFLASVGCQSTDPCTGHDGTCVALTVQGQGVSSVDQLRYRVVVGGSAQPLTGVSPAQPGAAVSLPTDTAIYFDPGVMGAATLTVDGERNGLIVGSGATSFELSAGGHLAETVVLIGSTPDGGANDDLTTPPEDLAGADLTGFDLAGSDLAAQDLASSDLAGSDLAASAPCPVGSLFCDDFEGETMAFGKWNGSFGVGTMATFALNNTHPFLYGTESFEVASTGGGFSLHKTLTAVTSGTLAVRFYVFVSSALTGAVPFLYFTNNGSPISVGSGSTGKSWILTPSPDVAPPIAVGSWQCVELDLDFATSKLSLYATDGTTPDRGAGPIASGPLSSTGITEFYLGIYSPPTAGTADLWFDDVAVATQHVGCE
jgi:hypothetical protein